MSTITTPSPVVEIDLSTVALWTLQGEEGARGRFQKVKRWSYEAIKTTVERVNKGAALLDEEKPGWVNEIFPDRLDMSSSEFCIIGQAYGDYGQIAVPFGMDIMGDDYLAIAHGFVTDDEDDPDDPNTVCYPLLDRVWGYLLSERKRQSRPVLLALPEREPLNVMRQRLINAGMDEFRPR